MITQAKITEHIVEMLSNNKGGLITRHVAWRIKGVSIPRANYNLRRLEAQKLVRLKASGQWAITAKGRRFRKTLV